jgi:hypothetical protein
VKQAISTAEIYLDAGHDARRTEVAERAAHALRVDRDCTHAKQWLANRQLSDVAVEGCP